MNIEEFRLYCLSKPGTTESMPFGGDTLVFKVMGKMFALVGLEKMELSTNLKCDPDYALELRESYPEVQPGYHMNKKHWNTVVLEGNLKKSLFLQLVDHSYELVVSKLTKKLKEELQLLSPKEK